jgi:hypothetical protein
MNTSHFSAAARREAVRQLKQNGPLYREVFSKHWENERELTQVLLDDHARRIAGEQLVNEVVSAKEELDSLKCALSERGFDLDDDRLSLSRFAPDGLHETIQQEVDRRIGSDSDIRERFDNARMAMLTTQNYDDAERIMNSVKALIN